MNAKIKFFKFDGMIFEDVKFSVITVSVCNAEKEGGVVGARVPDAVSRSFKSIPRFLTWRKLLA